MDYRENGANDAYAGTRAEAPLSVGSRRYQAHQETRIGRRGPCNTL